MPPVNFFSPYKAGNINETWARWNITLGHFFGSYVFKPLGGRSRGRGIAARNVIILMLLSGAWHGAGWNYLIWGLMNTFTTGLIRPCCSCPSPCKSIWIAGMHSVQMLNVS